MVIVGGFDIHRRQVTVDYLDTVTGQVRRGRIAPACRAALREWLQRFAGRGDVTFAVEGCTRWRFVAGELARAGIIPLLPSRPRPLTSAGASGARRPARLTRATCAPCR